MELTKEEEKLIMLFRSLDERGKQTVIESAEHETLYTDAPVSL